MTLAVDELLNKNKETNKNTTFDCSFVGFHATLFYFTEIRTPEIESGRKLTGNNVVVMIIADIATSNSVWSYSVTNKGIMTESFCSL
jgi:hypothetical protein